MKNLVSFAKEKLPAIAVVAGMLFTTPAAKAQPLLMPSVPHAPVTVHAPVVVSKSVGPLLQTKVLNTYRQVRAFWLSRAIVR